MGIFQKITFLFALQFSIKASAFDPTAIITQNLFLPGITGASEVVDDIGDLGFSFLDLMDDLGVETGVEESLDSSIKRLEEINKMARDLKWTEEDIRQNILVDLNGMKSAKEKINAVRKMIAASKRVAEVIRVKPKTGERAAQMQAIKINSMILEELQAQNRRQLSQYLENKEHSRKREVLIQQIKEDLRKQPFWRRR